MKVSIQKIVSLIKQINNVVEIANENNYNYPTKTLRYQSAFSNILYPQGFDEYGKIMSYEEAYTKLLHLYGADFTQKTGGRFSFTKEDYYNEIYELANSINKDLKVNYKTFEAEKRQEYISTIEDAFEKMGVEFDDFAVSKMSLEELKDIVTKADEFAKALHDSSSFKEYIISLYESESDLLKEYYGK